MNLERYVRGIIYLLSRRLPRGTEENQEKLSISRIPTWSITDIAIYCYLLVTVALVEGSNHLSRAGGAAWVLPVWNVASWSLVRYTVQCVVLMTMFSARGVALNVTTASVQLRMLQNSVYLPRSQSYQQLTVLGTHYMNVDLLLPRCLFRIVLYTYTA
jgi:hypothetical protein